MTPRRTKMVGHIRYAAKRGYRVDRQGRLFNPKGDEIFGRAPQRGRRGQYKIFSIRLPDRETGKIYVHQLQAYQKFGEKALSEGAEVRHINGDSLDNRWNNIKLGTRRQNIFDHAPKKRREHAQKGADAVKKWSDDEVRRLRFRRRKGETVTQLAEEEGVGLPQMSMMLRRKTYKGVR